MSGAAAAAPAAIDSNALQALLDSVQSNPSALASLKGGTGGGVSERVGERAVTNETSVHVYKIERIIDRRRGSLDDDAGDDANGRSRRRAPVARTGGKKSVSKLVRVVVITGWCV